jgi:NADP-reducing hydrogenase subunit HndB
MTVKVLNEKPVIYENVDVNKVRQIFKQHVLEGKVQREFALAEGDEE